MEHYKKVLNDFFEQFRSRREEFILKEERDYSWHYGCKHLYSEWSRADRKWSYWYVDLTSKGHDFLNSAYYQITNLYNLDVEKETLKQWFLNNAHYPKSKKKDGTKWWEVYSSRHNRSNKYVHKKEHKKKELTEREQHRREWRKRFEKDKRKTYWKHPWKRRIKEDSKIKNRAQEKQLIYSGTEDMIKPYNRFSDGWYYD